MEEAALDRLFAALAHPGRRRIIDLLVDRGRLRLVDLAERFCVSRIAVLKHVRVLEQAGLIIAERAGRERYLAFNAVPIQLVYDRWTDQYSGFWAGRMSDLKARLESPLANRGAERGPESRSARRA